MTRRTRLLSKTRKFSALMIIATPCAPAVTVIAACQANPIVPGTIYRLVQRPAASWPLAGLALSWRGATTSAFSSSIAACCPAITGSRAAHDARPGAGGGRSGANHRDQNRSSNQADTLGRLTIDRLVPG